MNKDGSTDKVQKSRKTAEAEAREARLKSALRANLRRRKGQKTARKPDDPTPD